MNLMREYRKRWQIFLLPIILCGCEGPLAPPRTLFIREFTPFVSFYGYNRSKTATFRGYLYRDSLLIDSCYFDYSFNGQDEDAYGEQNPINVITKLCFYNSEIAPLDSIAYTDTLFIHTGYKIHKVYNMHYARHREYLARWPYTLAYTVDGIETYNNDFPTLYKNGYWTPASSYKLLTKEFTPFVYFDSYTQDEIATFKGYLYRNNHIVDSCNFEYLWKGEDEYAMRITTRLHFYNSEMTPRDSIAYTDTLFIHTGHKTHKMYNIYYVLNQWKIHDGKPPYLIKFTLDSERALAGNSPTLFKNGSVRTY